MKWFDGDEWDEIVPLLDKMYSMFSLMVWTVGVFGGFGYLWYYDEKIPAICVSFVGLMAYPHIMDCFKELKG